MTAEEAIKELREASDSEVRYGDTDNHYDEVMKRVEAFDMAITALEQTRWIPCTERLPKTNDIYLVSMHSYGLPTRDIDGYIQQTDKKWEVYGNKVIAWMPLPEPYMAESEDKE